MPRVIHTAPNGDLFLADSQAGSVFVLRGVTANGKAETVSPVIGLYFTDKPQTKFPYLVQLEHDGAIDIPAGDADFVVGDDFRTSMDVNVLAVYPHAHYLAKVMEAIYELKQRHDHRAQKIFRATG